MCLYVDICVYKYVCVCIRQNAPTLIGIRNLRFVYLLISLPKEHTTFEQEL